LAPQRPAQPAQQRCRSGGWDIGVCGAESGRGEERGFGGDAADKAARADDPGDGRAMRVWVGWGSLRCVEMINDGAIQIRMGAIDLRIDDGNAHAATGDHLAPQAWPWSREEKRAILTESFEDGVVISEVARRYGLRPQQLFTWRNEFRKRGLARFQSSCATIEPPAFAPVMIARSGQEAEAPIEIVLDAATIRLHGEVDGKALAVVLRAVKAAS
jgi:transposase